MHGQKLLIADAADELTRFLIRELRDAFEIRICRTGAQTLELLDTFEPDVLVLDMMLPDIDSVTVLQTAREKGTRCRILAIVTLGSSYVMESLVRFQVDYAMAKPCVISALSARIRDLGGFDRGPAAVTAPPQEQAAKSLMKLGFSTKTATYQMLRMSLVYAAYHPGCQVTKELYPHIASAFGRTCTQVERVLRDLIQHTWERRKEEVWDTYFPDNSSHWPSNRAFISRLAAEIRLEEGESPAWK